MSAPEPLPDWLTQLITALSAGPEPAAGRAWEAEVRGYLANPELVPLAAVHDWHATTVVPLLSELCAEQAPVGELHAQALAGRPVTAAQWTAALRAALPEVYRRAYAYRAAWQVNYDSAQEYGTAHNFGDDGTREYAVYYADLATGANLRAYADANTIATAAALAIAFASADPLAYAESCPYATVRAYALALASSSDPGQPGDQAGQETVDQSNRERAAYARLALGLAASLHRVTDARPARQFGP
jgi:hypothetical protein